MGRRINCGSEQTMIFDLDLIQLATGEILSSCGTYEGDQCRARVTFIPDGRGDRSVANRRYTKITYNHHGDIPNCTKLLDLPGEEHYLIPHSEIVAVFRPSEGFRKLVPEDMNVCNLLINMLETECQIAPEAQGLAGSSALGCRTHSSDFDWVVYDGSAVERVERFIESCPQFESEWPFTTTHVISKYRQVTSLPPTDVLALFARKRKYFQVL